MVWILEVVFYNYDNKTKIVPIIYMNSVLGMIQDWLSSETQG